MDEITCEKSIKSVKSLPEYRYVTDFLELPDAEHFLEYRYARNFLDDPKILESLGRSLEEMIVHLYKTSYSEEHFPSHLIADSRETKGAWDALYLIAQDWLRAGKPPPPELAEWIADVLADQSVKRKGKKERRPRPDKGAHRLFNRNLLLCVLVSQLACAFDLKATRNDGDPPLSACDVAAAAVTKSTAIARELSYSRVERIWGTRELDLEYPCSSETKQALRKNPFYPR